MHTKLVQSTHPSVQGMIFLVTFIQSPCTLSVCFTLCYCTEEYLLPSAASWNARRQTISTFSGLLLLSHPCSYTWSCCAAALGALTTILSASLLFFNSFIICLLISAEESPRFSFPFIKIMLGALPHMTSLALFSLQISLCIIRNGQRVAWRTAYQ